jgi:uncharacterized membrane protein (DUF4010 family)
MFPRVLIVVGVFAPAMVSRLALPLALAALVAYAAAFVMARKGHRKLVKTGDSEKLTSRNPFELKVALQFGLLLAVIMVAARAMQEWLGDAGIFLLAAVSGLGDVDAITLSVASMTVRGELDAHIAGMAVVLASAANTLIKPALTLALGTARMAIYVAGPLILALLIAAAGVYLPDIIGLGAAVPSGS